METAFVHHMPDGRPAPSIMTSREVIAFLRIDEINIKDPIATLDYYRQRGLKARRISRAVRYRLEDVLAFVEGMPDA